MTLNRLDDSTQPLPPPDVQRTTLSIDLMVAWACGIHHIREAVPFPGGDDVTEDDDQLFNFDRNDPNARNKALYGFLGVLLEEIVEVQLT